jgi:hypothetical protein
VSNVVSRFSAAYFSQSTTPKMRMFLLWPRKMSAGDWRRKGRHSASLVQLATDSNNYVGASSPQQIRMADHSSFPAACERRHFTLSSGEPPGEYGEACQASSRMVCRSEIGVGWDGNHQARWQRARGALISIMSICSDTRIIRI